MKKINEQSTRIFCSLLKKLNQEQYIKITVDGFMPLTMELLEIKIAAPFGVATLYSLCHHYVQNGDLLRDPEMCFLVVDKGTNFNDHHAVEIYPQMYQLDNLGIYEESICIENGSVKSFIKLWQWAHCNFANIWLNNIKHQGFLK
jgi:hypothetical protein